MELYTSPHTRQMSERPATPESNPAAATPWSPGEGWGHTRLVRGGKTDLQQIPSAKQQCIGL